jgi:hypothetical protein
MVLVLNCGMKLIIPNKNGEVFIIIFTGLDEF